MLLKDAYTPLMLNLCGFSMVRQILQIKDVTEDKFWKTLDSVYVGRVGNA